MNVDIATVDITTVHERVYRELRAALQQGRLVSGQAMTVRVLARAVGTSEMPVREALRRLLAEGALVQAPNRTFQIVPMTRDRLTELTRIRAMLEGMAGRLAVAAEDSSLVARLTRLNGRMRAAVEAASTPDLLSSNQEFHFAIYEAARSPQLFEIIDVLWLRSGPYLARTLLSEANPLALFRRGTLIHDRLIRALARGDADGVEAAIADDISRTARSAIRHLGLDRH